MKSNEGFWRVLDKPDQSIQSEDCQFLHMLSSVERWRGSTIPDKVGKLKSKSAVVLQPMSEHLVWGRLSPGLKLSMTVRSRLVDLIKEYECVFSRHSLDCGEAKGFCHRIRLTDDKPFPYYHKLKQSLDEMEQNEIIRKSIFGKDEEESLQRLEMVFQRLKDHNLKLSPSKCRSVKFLGVASDPMKVEAITNVSEGDLMEADGVFPSVGKIFLGMVIYYQHFIENCSMIAKPLFQLTTGQKKPRKARGIGKRIGAVRKLTPDDWTDECRGAFENLKAALVKQVLLPHPDFSRPFILSVDASTNGLGEVSLTRFGPKRGA
ncbi:Retrovirus-related Pol polyprotein from transposon gypsy [Labeo rohita]|uniref:Retrovirus-related Pol polyprotein from transposon gypsy n=1 Tax=Labeo rohita TaxID=84645 RepID=A0ABQ8LA53_LABRO|nr:Retrovirus-related Pol polyprotein from transposon gypsy [Labeo rohita]